MTGTECSICGNPKIEAFGRCASCNADIRKQDRQAAKVKIVAPVKKVSPKRAQELREYQELREMFLNMEPNHFCHVEGCRNQATEVHHTKGREGCLLLDTVFFMAVCRTCHERITRDSNWAIINGYSEKRTI